MVTLSLLLTFLFLFEINTFLDTISNFSTVQFCMVDFPVQLIDNDSSLFFMDDTIFITYKKHCHAPSLVYPLVLSVEYVYMLNQLTYSKLLFKHYDEQR